MHQEPDSPKTHQQRSEFIRKLVQRPRLGQHSVNDRYRHLVPRTIVQFWHDLRHLPHDVEECVVSWTRWEASGFTHRLFDEHSAKAFIGCSLGARHECAFDFCRLRLRTGAAAGATAGATSVRGWSCAAPGRLVRSGTRTRALYVYL